ncbi:MAG: PAS domain S-box protein [Cyanobacteriota bacterium]
MIDPNLFDGLPSWIVVILWGFSLGAVIYWCRQTQKYNQEGFPELLILARPDTQIVKHNHTHPKLPGDWRGRRWIEFLTPAEQVFLQEKLAQLTPQQPTFTFVHSLPAAGPAAGEEIWLEWINQGLFDRQGRLKLIRSIGRDITQQKELERALQMREAQLRTLSDALPIAVWARDPQGILVLQNATDRAWFGDRLGTSLEEALNEESVDEIKNFWRESMPEVLAEINERGIYQREGTEIILGEKRYTYRITVPIQNQPIHRIKKDSLPPGQREKLGLLGIVLDLTEQKRLEQKLKQQEAQFQAVVENYQDILHYLDRQGRLYCLNPKTSEAILGCTFSWGEPPLLDFVHPEDQDNVKSALQSLLTQPGLSLQLTYRMQHADGHWVWLESLATSWIDDPLIQGIVSSSRDISCQKQVELCLQESEQQLKAILDGIPFPIFLKDREGRYIQVNTVYLRLHQLSREEVLGKTDAELFSEQIALLYQQGDEKALFSEEPISYEQVVPYPEQEITNLVTKFALRHKNGDPYALCGIHVDISSLKAAQNVLLQEAQRERLLGSLLQRSRQSLDLNQVLQTTVEEVRRCLQVDRVMIYQLENLGEGVVAAESVQPPWPSHLGRSVSDACFGADSCYRKYAQGFVQVLSDVRAAELDPCYRELLDSFQAQANLVVPIQDSALEGDLWGLLVAQHCQSPRRWQEWEIKLLQELGSQLTITLRQAQLYQQVRELNQSLQQEIERRNLELERSLQFEFVLKSITDRVRDSLDEVEILNGALLELGKNLQLGGCNISLYNSDLTVSTITYEYSPQVESNLNFSISSISMVGGAYDDLYRQLIGGQPCLFCSLFHPKESPWVVFACPLMDKDQPLGDLWVFRRPEACFDEQELPLVRQVANQCVIGLRQARLFRAAQEQVRALERLNQLKDDFISTVSHELRTPLTSLKIALQMLQVTPPGEKHAQYLGIAQRECQREIELINDLLNLQQLEVGGYTPDIRTLTWEALLADLLSITAEQTQSRGQQFQASVPLEQQVRTDPTLLGRVLREFLHNAVKYTPAQGSIYLEIKADSEPICIQVSNSQEIPPEELPRIFQRFYRIKSQDPWKEGGTGLGLALVKQIVNSLQGSIEVSSSGGWTTFTLWLPQAYVEKKATLHQKEEKELGKNSLSLM